MIIDNKLKIFENFQIVSKMESNNGIIISNSFIGTNDGTNMVIGGVNWVGSNESWEDKQHLVKIGENVTVHEFFTHKYNSKKTILNYLMLKVVNLFVNPNKVKENTIVFQRIGDFFQDIFDAAKELDLDENSLGFYKETMETAKLNNQQALVDILVGKRESIIKELALVGYKPKLKYVEESDVVELYKKSEKECKFLKLTWMKNYVRVIPVEVIEEKKKFDNLGIFDNYVILHFDLNNESTRMTNKEVEQAKDPILFGVFRDSRKLYFIGDWVDEYCDLTLDKFYETLAIKAKDRKLLTNESIVNDVTGSSKVVEKKPKKVYEKRTKTSKNK
jgi:hypothetical protein